MGGTPSPTSKAALLGRPIQSQRVGIGWKSNFAKSLHRPVKYPTRYRGLRIFVQKRTKNRVAKIAFRRRNVCTAGTLEMDLGGYTRGRRWQLRQRPKMRVVWPVSSHSLAVAGSSLGSEWSRGWHKLLVVQDLLAHLKSGWSPPQGEWLPPGSKSARFTSAAPAGYVNSRQRECYG